MQNFNLGIAKMSVIPENLLFPHPVLPKTSVIASQQMRGTIKTPANELENELYHMLRSNAKHEHMEPTFLQHRMAWLGVQYDIFNNR